MAQIIAKKVSQQRTSSPARREGGGSVPSFVQSLLDEFASGFDEEEATFRNVNRDGVGPRGMVGKQLEQEQAGEGDFF